MHLNTSDLLLIETLDREGCQNTWELQHTQRERERDGRMDFTSGFEITQQNLHHLRQASVPTTFVFLPKYTQILRNTFVDVLFTMQAARCSCLRLIHFENSEEGVPGIFFEQNSSPHYSINGYKYYWKVSVPGFSPSSPYALSWKFATLTYKMPFGSPMPYCTTVEREPNLPWIMLSVGKEKTKEEPHKFSREKFALCTVTASGFLRERRV